MSKETDSESNSKEEIEEVVEEKKKIEDDKTQLNDEEHDQFSLPMSYSQKLGFEEEEDEDEPTLKRTIGNLIIYLDGKSRTIVIGTLVIFIISIFNFIAWNFTELESLKYIGTTLALLMLIAVGSGILISFNVYNTDLKVSEDIRMSGLILSIGSVLVTLFFMIYEIRENSCLT